MTRYEEYVLPLLERKGNGRIDWQNAYKRMNIVVARSLCYGCVNRPRCEFKEREGIIYSKCQMFEEREKI